MTNTLQYLAALDQQQHTIQQNLNKLIDDYGAHPVGNGYIDIIVLRDRYVNFIDALTDLNLAIEYITWWCHATDEHKVQYGCPHGSGGPMTKFGWFSEITFSDDEIDKQLIQELELNFTPENINKVNIVAASIIENKKIDSFADGNSLIFQENECLTPAFWIRVPDNWRNI